MDSAPATNWRKTFERYMALKRGWEIAGAPAPVADQFFHRIVHAQQSEAVIKREFQSFRLKAPPQEILDEAFYLQRTLYPADRRRPEGRRPDDALEDVYAAALSMLPHGFWVESPDREQLYRGQRNAGWRTLPSLFRGSDADESLARLGRAVGGIRAAIPGLNEDQGVAVAQHYSKELKVATWLLDVTWDPRVALFFASHGGVDGDIGVVNCIVQKEWRTLSADGSNRLGQLRVIDVPGVLRIDRQRASFLDTSHPDLFDQYVAHSVWFKQRTGTHFEDIDADHPVAERFLYPPGDPTIERLTAAVTPARCVLQVQPAGDAREPLGKDAYWEIAQSWCRQDGVEIDAYREDTLKVVCAVYAELQTLREEFEVADRSLLRLQEATDFIMTAQREDRFVTPSEALRWTLSRLAPPQREKLQAVINRSAKEVGLC